MCKLINKILNAMLEYQENNNIREMCVTNVQFLYDLIISNTNLKVKAKSVICIYQDEINNSTYFISHMILAFDNGDILDPSWEWSCKNVKYYDNIKSCIDSCYNLPPKEFLYKCINENIKLQKLANDINDGNFTITCKDYYNKQADFVEKKLKMLCVKLYS